MTVKQLREILLACDDDQLIVLSIDPEGNGYSVFSGISDGRWSVRWREFSADDDADGVPAICLWPS
jgi:hypothetical protein